uniref:Uncharacterized protein LOC111133104 n=1 Tax=Crassostrea virginica TaxID=6565 RepID=A0A8B8E9U9_CRAVI|nr:uncharacterized protein LOC111133104 [Crassostrea virginica]
MDEQEFKCDFNSFYPYICDTSHVQRIVHCDKDTRNYLCGLKCSESIAGKPFQFYVQLSRGPRSGLFTIDKCVLQMRICKNIETIWVCHGGNPGRSVNGNGKADRGACASMCKELWISKRHLLPIGAGICKHCQKRHKQDLPATCRIDFAKELESFEHIADSMDKVSKDTRVGDLSSFQCIAAADKNT